MKNYLKNSHFRYFTLLITVMLNITIFNSCKDDYLYDDVEPVWLGSNIYDYLKDDGHFTNYLKLVDDLEYAEVLKLTGSKTLFVANDSAFNEFYKNNPWNVRNYEQLTTAQKKMLLKYSMLNNAYLIETLSNYNFKGTLNEGMAMRCETELAAIDSIPFQKGENLPDNPFWTKYKTKGLYLMKDNSNTPLVFFTQKFLTKYGFTDEDFGVLAYGQTRVKNDAHIFNIKIIKRDIVCKNGFVNILDKVLIPPINMAEYIENNADTKIFSKLMNRFCAPYYDATKTNLYKQLHPEFSDSIFTKRYFSSLGPNAVSMVAATSGTKYYPDGVTLSPNLLTFDPGWNLYSQGAVEADMAAMFVPSDAAMNEYLNSDVGQLLKNSFGTWENIPDEIIMPLIKRHMRTSLKESIPSRFSLMVDAENYKLPVEKSHVVSSYTGVNGEVYVTNKVYPPVDFISVYGPVLFSNETKIMRWAIKCFEKSSSGVNFEFYRLYLNSLVNNYSLFIPTDNYFQKVIDPIAYGQDVQGAMKFWWDAKNNVVNATIYKYNKASGIVGDSVGFIPGNADGSSANLVRNRLWSLLDSHIVVGNVKSDGNSGSSYFITKANDIIKVAGSGSSLTVQGGDDMMNNVFSNTTSYFPQTNGKTYFLDKPIQPALKSVYKTLSENPEFSSFFALLNGAPTDSIFIQQGIDYKVKFFNAFQYTVYVPTNKAIDDAIAAGDIQTWSDIYAMPAITTDQIKAQKAGIHKLLRFIRYHFQDNAVFADQIVNNQYQSATLKEDLATTYFNTARNRFLKIGVQGNGTTLTLTMDTKDGSTQKAKVVTQNGLYNLVVKDYIFGNYTKGSVNTVYKNVDGTGSATGAMFSTSSITATASAVIHQIDNILKFE